MPSHPLRPTTLRLPRSCVFARWGTSKWLTLIGTALWATAAPACVQAWMPPDADPLYEPAALAADPGFRPDANAWHATHRPPNSTRMRRRRLAWQSP